MASLEDLKAGNGSSAAIACIQFNHCKIPQLTCFGFALLSEYAWQNSGKVAFRLISHAQLESPFPKQLTIGPPVEENKFAR